MTVPKVCEESTIELVDKAELASKVEWPDVKVQDMARLVTVEELVETAGLTSWSASLTESESSFAPSCKVQTGSLPTEVD